MSEHARRIRTPLTTTISLPPELPVEWLGFYDEENKREEDVEVPRKTKSNARIAE